MADELRGAREAHQKLCKRAVCVVTDEWWGQLEAGTLRGGWDARVRPPREGRGSVVVEKPK